MDLTWKSESHKDRFIDFLATFEFFNSSLFRNGRAALKYSQLQSARRHHVYTWKSAMQGLADVSASSEKGKSSDESLYSEMRYWEEKEEDALSSMTLYRNEYLFEVGKLVLNLGVLAIVVILPFTFIYFPV